MNTEINAKTPVGGSARCYGIDALKAVSMLMVVILHVLGQGGILQNAKPLSAVYSTAWLLEIAAYCAVNCFAICTGFLMAGRKVKYRRMASLWVIVAFYTLTIMAVGYKLGIAELRLKYVLPVIFTEYWYFTAYFGVFFLIPFMNILVENMSEKDTKKLLLTMFVLFSMFPVVGKGTIDPFIMNAGYSMAWLCCMYFVGAAIKKYGIFTKKLSAALCLLGYIAAVLLTWISKVGMEKAIAMGLPGVGKLQLIFAPDTLVSYTSPTIVAASVFLVVFFVKCRIPGILHRPLEKLSPMVFQVHTIHLHYVIWNAFLLGRFIGFCEKSPPVMAGLVILTSIAIFTVCICIDIVRTWLFRLLRVDFIINKIADSIMKRK